MLKMINLPKLSSRTSSTRAWIILISLALWPISPVAAHALEPQESLTFAPSTSPTVVESEPCSLPAAGPTALSGAGLGVPLPGQGQGVEVTGSSQLVITCLRFTRSHYPLGMQWQTEIVVQNIGNAASGPFDATGVLCRFMENGVTFTCATQVWSLGLSNSGLAPGESLLLISNPHPFTLPTDPPGLYPSWASGLPDNGTIYLRASLGSIGLFNVTQAIYPTAPSDESGDLNFLDADQDGWSPNAAEPVDRDCDDTNPDIHPGALEVAGDSHPNDCVGGDASLGGPCDTYYGTIHGENEFCGQPGINLSSASYDLDGDGVTVGAGDCDDGDPWINPFAPEINDGLDNNCNGLVDETFAVPDWFIEEYLVERTMGEYSLANGFNILVPGLNYDVTLGNAGDYIGDDFSSLQAVGHYIPLISSPVAVGTSGFIPYTQIPSGHQWSCAEHPLTAVIANTGLFGEGNTANNTETFWLPELGPWDLSLHFDELPSLSFAGGNDSMRLVSHAAITGSCPDLPTTLNGGTDYIQIQRRLLGQNQVLHEETLVGLVYMPSIPLPETVSGGDRFCLQVTLDPNHLIAEDPNDNMYAIVYEYHNPIFGPPRFDLIEYYHGPAASVDFNSDGCQVSSVEGALIGSSPGPNITLISVVLVGLAGGIAGGIGGRVAGASGRSRWGFVFAGLLVGGALGGYGVGRLGGQKGDQADVSSMISVVPVVDTAFSLPTCEDLVRSFTTLPEDGAAIRPLETTPLTWQANFATAEQIPDRVTFLVVSPSGGEALLQADLNPRAEANTYETSGTIGAALYLHGINLFDEPGVYEWGVAIASGAVSDGGRAIPICAGTDRYTFRVLEPQRTPPTATATATATPTPTSTTAPILPPTSTPEPLPEPTKIPPKLTPTPTKKATKPSG